MMVRTKRKKGRRDPIQDRENVYIPYGHGVTKPAAIQSIYQYLGTYQEFLGSY